MTLRYGNKVEISKWLSTVHSHSQPLQLHQVEWTRLSLPDHCPYILVQKLETTTISIFLTYIPGFNTTGSFGGGGGKKSKNRRI